MQGSFNLTGHILCSQPKQVDSFFARSVLIIAKHGIDSSWGVMVNKPHDHITMNTVMESAGIEYYGEDKPIYRGGPVETHRVHVLHSLDWRSQSSSLITPEIGITGDISVLTAIAGGDGPKLYRVIAGVCAWGPGQLDGEYKGLPPWKLEHRWLDAPATIESVFDQNGDDQWKKSIEIVGKSVVSTWF